MPDPAQHSHEARLRAKTRCRRRYEGAGIEKAAQTHRISGEMVSPNKSYMLAHIRCRPACMHQVRQRGVVKIFGPKKLESK